MIGLFARAAVALTAVGVFAMGVLPAHAAGSPTLPANQQMFTFDYDEPPVYLWGVDSVDAGLAPIGLGTPGTAFISAQQNPADGLVYAIGFDGTFPTYLATINVTTGVGEKIHSFVGGPMLTTKLLFNNAGDAFAIGADGPGSDPSIYDLNLDTAVLSNPRSLGITDACIFGAAHNPVNDTLYAFCDDATYIVDWTTRVATADPAQDLMFEYYVCPGTQEVRDPFPTDYAFDANGDLWASSGGCNTELLFFDFATGHQTFVGQMHESTPSLYSNAPNYDVTTYGIVITTDGVGSPGNGTGSEEMADTGVYDGTNVLAVLAVAGIVAAVAVRRRSRF